MIYKLNVLSLVAARVHEAIETVYNATSRTTLAVALPNITTNFTT